ncbi:MAG: DHH family phosphoesterase [Bacilli bacterium]|nr:DHH family phosphoesterase [Bacilli bacterium]
MNEELKSIKDLLRVISESSDKVFIVGHDKSDLDSLASAIGLQALCESLGKTAYIILDEPEATMEPIVKKLRDDNATKHNIIDMSGFELLHDNESTLIVTDTNKSDRVAVKDYLDDFSQIIIIDHHGTGENTIKNASMYIPQSKEENDQTPKVKVSSASEIVAQLLLQAKVECDKDIYTYLYGGIYLDTNRFDKNVGEKTHDITHKLCAKGADTFAVKELFLADFDEDKVISDLVFNGTVLKAYAYDAFNNYTIGFTLNREKPLTIYNREAIAKAADRMMQYRIEAEFAMGHIDCETIKVSARSRGRLDVGKVMEYIGGGGNSQSAAAQIQGLPLTTLEDILLVAIEKGIHIGDEVIPPKDSTVISAPKQYKKNHQN